MNKLDKENFHKEIDLIQGCINRMASNSFMLKGWAVSIVAVVLALADKDINLDFLCLVVLIPLISFWYLDAFFLYTEKLYRKMYEWVIKERPNANNDRMYDLNPHRFKDELKIVKNGVETGKLETEWTVMHSKTLRWFYEIPCALIVVIFCISVFSGIKKDNQVTSQKEGHVNITEKKISNSK